MRMKPMRNIVVVLAFTACAHSAQSGGGGGGGQTGANSGPVPADVRKAVDAVLGPSAKITSEREDGATVYEAAIQTKLEVAMTDQGNLIETEIALPVASLPSAVTAALAGKGTISEAEVVVRPSGVVFEVEVGDTEYALDASGKILKQEQEHDEPGDEED
jgi:hypothetical protein